MAIGTRTFALVAVAVGAIVVAALGRADRTAAAARPVVVPAEGTEVRMRLSDTIALDDGALELTFVAVDEDSRCPTGVACIWQGVVLVTLAMTYQDAAFCDAQLTSEVLQGRGPSTLEVYLAGYVLWLVDLTPHPSADGTNTGGMTELAIAVRWG